MDCVVIGDEIAYNLATPLQCEIRAATGLTSSKVLYIAGGKFHTYCLVSAGTYDPYSKHLFRNLKSIRNLTTCKVYVWIKPVDPVAQNVLKSVVRGTNDIVVDFTQTNNLAKTIMDVTGN
jgi:hypothetical protein